MTKLLHNKLLIDDIWYNCPENGRTLSFFFTSYYHWSKSWDYISIFFFFFLFSSTPWWWHDWDFLECTIRIVSKDDESTNRNQRNTCLLLKGVKRDVSISREKNFFFCAVQVGLKGQKSETIEKYHYCLVSNLSAGLN